MDTKYVLVILALLLLVGVSTAATVSINVTAKELQIVESISNPQFFGVLTTNETTVSTYITGEQASLQKTLALLNQIKIGVNNLTVNGYIVTGYIS